MSNEKAVVVVQTTTATEEEAGRLAREVVTRRLAACVQIEPIRSVYRWKGALEESREFRLSCKTAAVCAEPLLEALRSMHSYELPELIVIPVLNGDSDYFRWVSQEITP